jgi:hypothetical protein
LALLAFLGAVAVAVLELMEMGEPGQTAEMKTASIGKHSSKIVAVAAAVLQILSIFITVVGYLSNSSLAYVVGSSLTMVTMGVATAAIISEIEDGNTEAANTRNSRAPSTCTAGYAPSLCVGQTMLHLVHTSPAPEETESVPGCLRAVLHCTCFAGYAYMGAVYFFLGFLSGSFSLLSAIRAEVREGPRKGTRKGERNRGRESEREHL